MTQPTSLRALWQLHQQGQVRAAESGYRALLSARPEDPFAWCYLGIALADQRRFNEAIAAYERSLELQANVPDTWNNLGNALRGAKRYEQAEVAFDRAVELRPGYALAELNRGTARTWRGDLDGALTTFERAAQLAPENPDIRRNLGVLRLLQGDYSRGWPAYRARWQMKGFHRPAPAATCWRGDNPAGCTFFLYPEQGLGDLIQFVRMAQVLKQRGARTIVGCPPRMFGLLQTCPGIDVLVGEGMQTPRWDVHCSLLEVAEHLVATPAEIPSQVPYAHAADRLIEYWKRWLGQQLPPGKRIGLAWQGNPQHEADGFRSIPLSALEPLRQIEGTSWLALQHGYGIEQIAGTQWAAGPRALHRLPPDTDQTSGAFMDSAAVLTQLDLLITTDTSIAHLAGALGCPVWLLLCAVPDWRWGLTVDQSPWYPTMRLWRQSSMGDWSGVIQQVKDALRDFVADGV
jgi:tetratricopeptide (TPR) repeat protein